MLGNGLDQEKFSSISVITLFILFIFNYLGLGMYHPECTINAAPTEILLLSCSSKFCFTQGFSTLLSFFFFLCYLDSLAINDLPLS